MRVPRLRISCFSCLVAFGLVVPSDGAENNALSIAIDSIDSKQLQEYIDVLADDSFEGREAGSRGGRAAANFLMKIFKSSSLKPAGERHGYFQSFNNDYRNILGILEGSDPELKKQYVVVSAHFDHVGYGTLSNSKGPTGYIHNGADDNASGVSCLLEILEAFNRLPSSPRRSILFALWDGEEKGLLGSKHWISQPTISIPKITMMANVDMIGRLTNKGLKVLGTRSGWGMRQFITRHNRTTDLVIDFPWELKNNSDHYPFFEREVPVLMFHTGLHDDYHKPSDDAHLINADGMKAVTQLLFQVVHDTADQELKFDFRSQARNESESDRKTLERAISPRKPRLGVSWEANQEGKPGLSVIRVRGGSAADRAGIRVGDRLIKIAGDEIVDEGRFRSAVLAAQNPVTFEIERRGEEKPKTLQANLTGKPVRLGISWREDRASPGVFILVQVVPGSPAALAGLQQGDRIYEFNGKGFKDGTEFLKLAKTLPAPIEILIERKGRLQSLTLKEIFTSNREVSDQKSESIEAE